jgi:hypothetical protein
MIGEFDGFPGKFQVGHNATDDLPGIGQRMPHAVNEVVVVNLAVSGTLKQSDGNVKGHGFLRDELRTGGQTWPREGKPGHSSAAESWALRK